MRFGRHRDRDLANLLDELRRIEIDAAAACRRAIERLADEPLTRGQLLSMLSEHESHRVALERLLRSGGLERTLSKLPASRGGLPTGLLYEASAFDGRRGSTAVLRVIRGNAEVAVRRYQAALRQVPPALEPVIRDQTNVWLRHRAWLTARIEAFARTRDSQSTLW